VVVPAAVPDAAHLVANAWDVAEFHQRRAPRSHRILAAFDSLFDVHRQMAANLVVEVAFVRSHGSLLLPS
jgi:hypothetical protein